ncbi:MAG: DUF4124 domain-containing protein [Betaproteobacteria bacterium]|nr:DUF4124 domain-containing protein [Betaproteobacteria bacterium]
MNPGLVLRTAFLLSMLGQATAIADTLYKCTDDTGVVLYTNQKGTAIKCTVLSRDQPISTFPAPRHTQRSATPSDFPRVDGGLQRDRDAERRKILEQELATEQQNLEKSRKELGEQEAMILPHERSAGGVVDQAKVQERIDAYRSKAQLHERNIVALKSELANLK